MKKLFLIITCVMPIFSVTCFTPAQSMLATAAPGETQGYPAANLGNIRIAHQVRTGGTIHRDCLSGGYGAPWARKSGYHAHGGGASKYGVACTPYIKAPQPQILSPGALQKPKLIKP